MRTPRRRYPGAHRWDFREAAEERCLSCARLQPDKCCRAVSWKSDNQAITQSTWKPWRLYRNVQQVEEGVCTNGKAWLQAGRIPITWQRCCAEREYGPSASCHNSFTATISHKAVAFSFSRRFSSSFFCEAKTLSICKVVSCHHWAQDRI